MTNNVNANKIVVYTDGSCHTQKKTGAWVAMLLYGQKEILLQGTELNTTHNRMELMAIIKAIEYAGDHFNKDAIMQIFTDSQYAMGLPARSGKLAADNFITQKGTALPNADLLKILFELFKSRLIHLNKVKAHQKKDDTINYNIVVDKLSRSLVRTLAK